MENAPLEVGNEVDSQQATPCYAGPSYCSGKGGGDLLSHPDCVGTLPSALGGLDGGAINGERPAGGIQRGVRKKGGGDLLSHT